MNYLLITIIQALVFISYVTFLLIKFKGPLTSISDSWYKLGGFDGKLSFLFTLFCWGIAIPMLFQGQSTALFFLSGAGLSFVGVATMFKSTNDITPYIHFIGAGIGIIFALIGIGVERFTWIPLISFAVLSLLLKLLKVNNIVWWIEIVAFISIVFGLFLTI